MLARSGVDNGGEEHMFSDFTDKLSSNGQNPAWFFRYGNNSFVTEKQQFGVEIQRYERTNWQKIKMCDMYNIKIILLPTKTHWKYVDGDFCCKREELEYCMARRM